MSFKKAVEYEAKGQFESALIEYQSINLEKLSNVDKIYIKRSIAACLFYLKKYTEAEIVFKELLIIKEIDSKEFNEIEDCLNICYLYGNNPKLAFSYYCGKIMSMEISKLEKMWAYWYIGQYYYIVNNYKKCCSPYKKSYKIAHILNIENKAFFFAHYLISYIYINENEKAHNELNNYEEKIKDNDISYGLLNIAKGIIYKIMKKEKWNEIFLKGINEAKESKYQENVTIGFKLNKEFG